MVTFENNNVNEQINDSGIFNEMVVSECSCEIASVSSPDDRMTVNYGTNKDHVAYKKILIFKRHYNRLLVLNQI